MCFEEDLTKITGAPGNPVATITGTSYALGARGIDMLRPFEVESTSGYPRTYGAAQFPLYDGHGNMMATLSRSSSSPYYAVGSERRYDVWGGVRSGASSGDPSTRYCANLGHKQDDESDLIYMRARYYEPGTGRFISEDSARDGTNWYVYCGNEPLLRVDPSGRFWWYWVGMALIGAISGMAAYATYQIGSGNEITAGGLAGAAFIGLIMGVFGGVVGVNMVTTWTAVAAGEALAVAFATGVFGAGVGALGGAIHKGVERPGSLSGLGRVLAAVMGYQFLLATILNEDL